MANDVESPTSCYKCGVSHLSTRRVSFLAGDCEIEEKTRLIFYFPMKDQLSQYRRSSETEWPTDGDRPL